MRSSAVTSNVAQPMLPWHMRPCNHPRRCYPPSAHVAGISQLLGFLCLEVMSRMTGMVVTVMASSLVCMASQGSAAEQQWWDCGVARAAGIRRSHGSEAQVSLTSPLQSLHPAHQDHELGCVPRLQPARNLVGGAVAVGLLARAGAVVAGCLCQHGSAPDWDGRRAAGQVGHTEAVHACTICSFF